MRRNDFHRPADEKIDVRSINFVVHWFEENKHDAAVQSINYDANE